MRLRKPGSKPSRRSSRGASTRAVKARSNTRKRSFGAGTAKAHAKDAQAVGTRMAREFYEIVRELLRIPIALYMRVAERSGEVVLAGWLFVWPFLVGAWRLAGRVLAAAERTITPRRALVVVALATVVALAASQWAEYRSVSVGSSAYTGVVEVATAPEVDQARTGTAHSWVVLPIAAFAALLVLGAARGRPGLARLLVPVGLAVVAISVFVDRPKGLDLGDAAVAYEEASARLLSGFWAQLVCGVLLIVLGPLMARALKPDGDRVRSSSNVVKEKKRRVPQLRLPGARRPEVEGGS